MELWLEAPFAEDWGDDPFGCAARTEGTVYRALEGRRTVRFEHRGTGYFLKHHTGVGWGEITKNLLFGRLPVTGARPEWRALNHLRAHGVATPEPLAYGSRGWNPARRESFLVMAELTGLTDLETLARDWRETPPSAARRRHVIEAVAKTARRLHDSGVNHRDFYLCHLWLPPGETASPTVTVMDLHRAQIRARVPRRWRVKDLGALYYSALDGGLTRRDAVRFLRAYTGQSARRALREDGAFWRAVRDRAARIYRRDFKRAPRLPL